MRIRKLLIANRGEIACRIIATAHRMGLKTVAVFSDADARAKHVDMAYEAINIGPAPATDSYLRADAIIDAALRTGADAIHPGYGFLSENPDFVEAIEAAGLTFVGPPASAIRAMGLKDAAKALMQKAGVPVIPGYHGAEQDPAFLAAEAEKIGYPVLIKARAGGGGKGMRLVERPDDFVSALSGAQREGQASFGDPACLIEKYITAPRHIEVQILADAHGNSVHLFERDCSLQRRHQKVIEEAPAPGMTGDLRDQMGAAAVKAAQAVGYTNAGTVEFIVDGARFPEPGCFWFMEMNTRLQVEHPVTEAIIGLDLVELQLRIAAGEAMPFTQDDLSINGHAFEARIYAEDPARDFLPATGTLEHFALHHHASFENAPVRVDSGVREGDAITPHYDPMIAKLITHGPSRAEALARLGSALAETNIAGTTTNVGFLAALSAHAGFAEGSVDTGLIARDLDELVTQSGPTELAIALACLVALDALKPAQSDDPWASLPGWRHWGHGVQPVRLIAGEAVIDREIGFLAKNHFECVLHAHALRFKAWPIQDGIVSVSMDGHARSAKLVRSAQSITVFLDGAAHAFAIPDPLEAAADLAGSGDAIISPMPGLVRSLSAQTGQSVSEGDPLIIVEAMKMEHTLHAPRDGTVAEILTQVGAQVDDGALLIALEPIDE